MRIYKEFYKHQYIRKLLFWLLFSWISLSAFAQTRVLRGVVTDSLQQPLEFTNIMAKAIDKDLPFVFAVTNEKGAFEMRLKIKATYLITTSFMGYQPYSFKLDSLVKPGFKRIVLKLNKQALDEVVINYQTPVKISGDSIVYNVKHFVTGKERKLKAVLQELPGVEVDKNGQITVMGKKIYKVMVEGKDFFGGNSRLAVENIPADAVKKVQVIKDYNAVSFMKGLTDEQKMIINIKLKEGKKHFVFGDVVAGGNWDKNYLGKANLFYYSPKTNLSYIGNANDIGEISLSYQDIRQFESDERYLSRHFMPNPAKKSLFGFANKGDFVSKRTLFNALQWQQDLGEDWQFQVYGLGSKIKSTFQQEKENIYTFPQHFTQLQQYNKQTSLETGLGKINIIYDPKSNQYINFSVYINKNMPEYFKSTIDTSLFQNKYINTLSDENALQITPSLLWYHKFSKKHIIRFLSQYTYLDNRRTQDWSSGDDFLQSYITMQPANEYRLEQRVQTGVNKWRSLLKYYYKIDNRNHIYVSLGGNLEKGHWQNRLFQKLSQTQVDFNSFDNDLRYKRQNVFAGLQYRFKIGQSILTPGIYLHKIFQQTSQNDVLKKSKYLWLPEFNMDTKWFSGDVKLHYAAQTTWAPLQDYISGKTLRRYDLVFQGNPLLDNALYHDLNLNYQFFSFVKGIILFANIHYQRQITELIETSQLFGTDYYQKPIVEQQPLDAWDISIGFTKEWRKFHFKYNPFAGFSENINRINQTLTHSKNWMIFNDISVRRYYKTGLELSIGVRQDYLKSISDLNSLVINSLKPYFETGINYKNFELQTDFYLKYTYEANCWQKTGTLLNTSVLYQKTDKAFGFEVKIINLLDNRYKIRFMNTEFLTTKNETLLQPRIVMLNLHYKL